MVGKGIKILRESRSLTQDELAKRLGVSRQAICMWETDRRELKAKTLNKIAEVLNVTVDQIIKLHKITMKGGEKDMFTNRGQKEIKTKGKEEGMVAKGRQKKIKFVIKAPEANKVVLTGDFSSWNEAGVPMKRNKDGLWKTGLSLKPGRYEYKFIVDGQWWTDPVNSNTVSTSFGTVNSVKQITA